jgi:hypothetical protein
MDVRQALEAARMKIASDPENGCAEVYCVDPYTDHCTCGKQAREAIVAFLERVPEFGEATVSANYAERPVNTPSRILAAIREAQS